MMIRLHIRMPPRERDGLLMIEYDGQYADVATSEGVIVELA